MQQLSRYTMHSESDTNVAGRLVERPRSIQPDHQFSPYRRQHAVVAGPQSFANAVKHRLGPREVCALETTWQEGRRNQVHDIFRDNRRVTRECRKASRAREMPCRRSADESRWQFTAWARMQCRAKCNSYSVSVQVYK